MKLVIAQMQHETNTFSPVPTPWESFGNGGPFQGSAAYNAIKGTRLPMAAFIDLAEAAKAAIVTPVAAWANPSGPVDGKAYDRICDLICNEVSKGCDASGTRSATRYGRRSPTSTACRMSASSSRTDSTRAG